jgi:hypothetical protein
VPWGSSRLQVSHGTLRHWNRLANYFIGTLLFSMQDVHFPSACHTSRPSSSMSYISQPLVCTMFHFKLCLHHFQHVQQYRPAMVSFSARRPFLSLSSPLVTSLSCVSPRPWIWLALFSSHLRRHSSRQVE